MSYNEPTQYSLFILNLSRKDVQLEKKIKELSQDKITESLAHRIFKDENLFHEIEDLVIQYANEFKGSIQSNTADLWRDGIIDNILDYKEGLFRCDSLYMNAIIKAIGIRWIPSSIQIMLSERKENK